MLKLYLNERSNIIKTAPKLSQKVLFPSSFERQNVKYVLALFNEFTIAGLKSQSASNFNGTIEFLQCILKWWNIVNVKTLFKGQAKRLSEATAITEEHHDNILFLKKFCLWLDEWENISVPSYENTPIKGRVGKLTKETLFALRHTSATLIECTSYLLNELEYSYILLGKFQTDQLENRFGLYRRMSGCNYNVSVSQILESEKTLKIMNLLKVRSTNSEFNILNFTPNDVLLLKLIKI